MSLADSEKWDERYRGGAYAHRRNATPLVAKFVAGLKPGRALDVGCGAGRNALFLAASGFEVDAIDISRVGLDRLHANAAGPSNPDYRLAPNELLDTVQGMRVLYYREGAVTDPDGRRAALAQLVASNGEIALFND